MQSRQGPVRPIRDRLAEQVPYDDPRRTRRGRAVGYPRRGSWQRELKEERRRRDPAEIEFFVGIDLGQAGDYTAISVLQRTIREERAHYAVSYATRVRHIDYMEVVNGIEGLFRRPELPFARTQLVVDCTGVGRAVVDAMDIAGLWPARVTITGGQQAGGARLKWNVPKKELVFATLMALEQGRLKVVPGLACGDAVKEELRAFGRSTTAAGNARFEATGSRHDDLVSAISLALWYGEKVCRATLPHVPRDPGDRELTPVSKLSTNAELLDEFLRLSARGWR